MEKVISKDGTSIAYDKHGTGSPLILVDGALCGRKFGPMPKLAALLAQHFTVINYDRRGRGDSTDTKPYSPQREIDDLDALIQAARGPVYVCGFSSGAVLALEAAAKGLNIKKLALFETPYNVDGKGHIAPKDFLEHLTALIREDKRGEAVKYFIHDMVGLPAIAVIIMKLMPVWKKLKAVAHTLPYDAALLNGQVLPAQRAVTIKVPTLVLAGSKSPENMQNTMKAVAEAIPGSQLKILPGQTHNVAAKAIAPELISFFKA